MNVVMGDTYGDVVGSGRRKEIHQRW